MALVRRSSATKGGNSSLESAGSGQVLPPGVGAQNRRSVAGMSMELFEQHQGTHILQGIDIRLRRSFEYDRLPQLSFKIHCLQCTYRGFLRPKFPFKTYYYLCIVKANEMDDDMFYALALCDWSNLQLRRRNLARRHCGPKQHTDNFSRIGSVATFESIELLQTLKHITRNTESSINIKPLLMMSAMNMFSNYMCSVRFDSETDVEFKKIVDHFDEIFWEINQGYAVDFLPWLAPFYKKHMEKLSNWSQDIRSFILSRIVDQREIHLDTEGPEKDFLDGLLRVLHDDPNVDRNTIIFMLEDFLGGHSSVGNLVMLCLAAVARDADVGKKIKAEIDGVTKGKRAVTLSDKINLPYTEATILECLRYASSPIVPHVATEPAVIAGYGIEKGTVVFINNYELNTSDKYWDEPEKFDPNRFLERNKIRVRRNSLCDSGMESDSERSTPINKTSDTEKEVVNVRKNIPHFLPFSIGKRTCIGQTLVTTMSFVMFANIIQEFDIRAENIEDLKQRPACVALPKETFNLYLLPRKH
ncbi:Cytochrome P450 307a1 [Papilio machaon]|uniref:Cytochrome P450 307a1 n=1 Tax=Papilio machaon TaxID=76193 RepID=A0A194QTB2_PAPMA|nr:Cytochrome P450 307a1 [Papilio machaon]